MDKREEDEIVEEEEKEESEKKQGNEETQNGDTEALKDENHADDSAFQTSNEESVKSSQIYVGHPRSRSGKKIPSLLGIGIIILVIAISLFIFRGSGEKVEPSPTPLPLSETEPTPPPSPEASFDRSDYKVRVLNGTTTSGLAASTSAKIKDLGYKIEKTANATNSAFLKTVLRVKPDLKDLLENLIKDLSVLKFEGEKGPDLKDSDTSDGEIILGVE